MADILAHSAGKANALRFPSSTRKSYAMQARTNVVRSRIRSLRPITAIKAQLDDSVALADLRMQLDAALAVEDYQLAARLRDAIQQSSSDARLAVEDANTRFYNAFRSGNIKEMEAVWGEGEHVSVIHPGADCIAGREAVLESWRSVLSGVRPRAFKLDLEDVRIWASDTSAYVTCVEVIDADDSRGQICATNIFEKQRGKWMLVLHMGGPTPPRKRFRGFA